MEQVTALEGWVTGLEGQINIVSDYSEPVHHGLVELGGFTRVTDSGRREERARCFLYTVTAQWIMYRSNSVLF